ncbi:hypothetical protein IJ384_00665 [bacterium]|nr:hypothetical protein [bacterium]
MCKLCEFVKSHVNFGFQNITWVGVLTALAIIPAVMFLPERYGFENGVIENIQLVVLFLGLFFALRPKVDKKFFTFVALVLGILLIREVNCGRTIFFPIPGEENAFYRWSEIKYGWLAHVIYGIYMAFVGLYFLVNKLFITLWQKLWSIKFPIWNFVLLLIGMIGGLYAEEMHLLVFEESAELLFYVALVGFVYLYSRHEDFIKKD